MVDLHGQYERIRKEINNAIQEVLDTTAFINGPQVKTFAQHLAMYNQVEHVVPVPTARMLYKLLLMALGLQPGDEVIVPVHTYVATAEVIALLRLEPIFADCVADRFTIDVTKIEEKITPSHESNRSCSLVWPMRRHGTTYGYSPPTQTLRGRRHCTSYRGHLHVQ